MTAATTARCIVCGTVGSAEVVLDGLLRRCPVCTFSWTAAELAAPEDLHDESYFATGGYDDYYKPDDRRYEARLRLRWLLSTGPARTLLEAGCAAGFFVATARDAGIDARGVEISESAARYAREQLGLPVRQGDFEVESSSPPVEVVCAFHVLEHVADPVAFLDAAHAAIEPGGRLAIEVPNIASAAARRLGRAWPGIQPEFHRWHFTPESLGRLITDAGFEIAVQDSVFSRFYWRPWARRRHARELLIADWVASRSPRVSHPTLGDAVRIIARRRVTGAAS